MMKKRKDVQEIYPDFIVKPSSDLMVKGGGFYAIWNPDIGMWSTNEFDVAKLVDREVSAFASKMMDSVANPLQVKYMSSFESGIWTNYKMYLLKMPDTSVTLDSNVTFLNTPVKREDYVSKRVPYALEPGDYSAWDEIIGTLYDPEERAKIEWAIGAIISGDSKFIQKFLVLYGDAGTGKSTVLKIIQKLFQGYYTTFEAKALTASGNTFSTENFRNNPLVAIQHDGDLSKIEDNTKLNSIVSHEDMELHEKYKPSYTSRLNCFLFMATNRPVKITDSKSGIIRRLIDVAPSGRKIPVGRYNVLNNQIDFELGAIAAHCLDIYNRMGMHYYDQYKPFEMIAETDVFFNFVQENMFTFKDQDGCSLRQAWDMYKEYCDDAAIPFKLPMYKFRDELKAYFKDFKDFGRVNGKQVRSCYSGFRLDKVSDDDSERDDAENAPPPSLCLEETKSLLDDILAECPAQYASSNDKPTMAWDDVKTKLKDLDTTKVHYVLVSDEQHIVVDFDLKNEKGEKDPVLNLESASRWPPTYAEYSKGGGGIHLHYIYDGDISKLSAVYAPGIEIKKFSGKSSLRRRLTKCNKIPIAHISSGLPLKGEKPVLNYDNVASEKSIRNRIEKALRREYHPNTAPSVSLIYKILDDAYNSGCVYDVTDMRPRILAFANNSTHQARYCVQLVAKMKFKSEGDRENIENESDEKLVFFDCEVFPNLFLINWKYQDSPTCVRMINPKPEEVAELFKFKLVGFNNRRYDNHILYARYLGYDNQALFMLSQRLINGSSNATFSEAYNISYTDIYDFASNMNKKSLKKFEVELRIHHQELGLPWDEDVPEEKWDQVAEYCDNDVISTEKVFVHLTSDWVARQILAKISGLTVNDTTNQHSTRIIFGKNKTPQNEFNYRDLSQPVKEIGEDVSRYLKANTPLSLSFIPPRRDEECDYTQSVLPYFPGYTFEKGKSVYRGVEVGEGGYVYAEPGMYFNVALLDVESMHPSSIEDECLFGPRYTLIFSELKQARVAIKHKDEERLKSLLGGALSEFVDMAKTGAYSLKDLSTALKTVINSVYGLTAAAFTNPFRDQRNIDNIVAKRGALFMVDLMFEVKKRGFTVAHIKTDSIKIPNATPDIIDFVMNFGKQYGYKFEHEATYERMCLINDAVYIAKVKSGEHEGEWSPTGARFAHPYVFKTLFSKEPIEFDDLCEVKNVNTGYMYLDFNEGMPDVTKFETEKSDILAKIKKHKILAEEASSHLADLDAEIAKGHDYRFIGKTGLFVPMLPGTNGGWLVRYSNNKYDSVTGAKDYRWAEAEVVSDNNKQDCIDMKYYRSLVDDALDQISKYGDVEMFLSDEAPPLNAPPWCESETCENCPKNNTCTSLAAALT